MSSPVNALTLTWYIVAAGLIAVIGLIVYTLWSRGAVQRINRQQGNVWKRAYHLGGELGAGRDADANQRRLAELFVDADCGILAASALAVLVRQEAGEINQALFSAVRSTRLPRILHCRLQSPDPKIVIEALEIAEVLRVPQLLGDAAALTRHDDPLVVRAACDAVVSLDPRAGLGILIGLSDREESWVLDSFGRTIRELERRTSSPVPLSASSWRDAPVLAARALQESAMFDAGTVNDAVSTLIGCLDDASPAKRMSAIKALSSCLDNPTAQLALAGALGSSDRMTRYAAAAALCDNANGHRILRHAADQSDSSDAARIAAEILWSRAERSDALDVMV